MHLLLLIQLAPGIRNWKTGIEMYLDLDFTPLSIQKIPPVKWTSPGHSAYIRHDGNEGNSQNKQHSQEEPKLRRVTSDEPYLHNTNIHLRGKVRASHSHALTFSTPFYNVRTINTTQTLTYSL